MATSETARKDPETSTDRSREAAIYAAAVGRFAEIHAYLVAVGVGARVPRGQRLRVWRAVQTQIGNDAQLATSEAKRAQIEASGGRPLTFCFGRICRVPPLKQLVGAEIVWGDGCGIVVPDSTESRRGPIFARYCSACGESKQRRHETVIARLAATVWSGRMRVTGGWRVTCSGCSERFFTP